MIVGIFWWSYNQNVKRRSLEDWALKVAAASVVPVQ
jgi:hypothetical protein